MSGSTRRISSELSRLRSSRGLAGHYRRVFVPFVDHASQQLRWVETGLVTVSHLSAMASEMEDPDMQLALLRLGGPRLQSALLGSLLLSVWLDFLHLADVVLTQCPSYSVERLAGEMDHLRTMLEPAMTALASLETVQVEAAAADLPGLIGHFTREFAATRERALRSGENLQKILLVKELIESLASASVMKMALPRMWGPATSATLGVGLLVGSDGVMMGTRMVISAEWVEMMRRLVQAGVISLPAVSAAVRIHAGQVLMSEAKRDLPRGVREALGDGPEVGAMRETGRTGAGMAAPPRHHVLPQEFREWFEQRGFTGDMRIDQFCVGLEQASHQAIHGGGNWRLGRTWPGEWNQMIMKALQKAETRAGQMLTPREILKVVAEYMKDYGIPVTFTSCSGR
ncbi:Hypothetical protein AA314_09429 [Archangium gephyra]|uniref:DUF2380 domain-containing protein n=1 Tax=Archangium gephyra TaxID=48 RepID=A0AAC8QHI4_9BACT|nr:Hypothetical protein AA314_09429 [Archangium gephyra]